MISSMQKSLKLAAKYLANSCSDTGRFNYRVSAKAGITYKPTYNMVRHCGAVYALMKANQTLVDPNITKACEGSISFVTDKAISVLNSQRHCTAVWSSPQLEMSHEPISAKLGASSLALLAILTDKSNYSKHIHAIRGLTNFILKMQKTDGSFATAYIPILRFPYVTTPSISYPSQALLALTKLYSINKNSLILHNILRGLLHIVISQKNMGSNVADYWGLLAIANIIECYQEPDKPSVSKQALMTHALRITENIMAAIPSESRGNLTTDGKTVNTALAVESLMSIMPYINSQHSSLRNKIGDNIKRGVDYLLSSQIDSGAFIGGILKCHPEHSDKNKHEVRIDYVAQTLNALHVCLTAK